jgi:hypothetical protein
VWRVTAVLGLSGGLLIAEGPAAHADNCDIRINPLDCQNTAWVVGSVAAIAACGAVVAASVVGGRPNGPRLGGDTPAGGPPGDTPPGAVVATAQVTPRGQHARQDRDSQDQTADVEAQIQISRQHTICAVAGGFRLYWDARDELARAGTPGAWLPGTEDFTAAARRAGFVAPEPVQGIGDLFAALWPLPDGAVHRLILLCHAWPQALGFAGGWGADGRSIVFTSALTERDIVSDPRIAQLSRVFGRGATVDIYSGSFPVGQGIARGLAAAFKVRVRTFGVPVQFHIAQAGGLVGARGAMSCPGLAGSTVMDLIPPLAFEPPPRTS